MNLYEPQPETISDLTSFEINRSIPNQSSQLWQRGMMIQSDIMIEKEIGWGGMGVVYLGISTVTGKKWAVKRLAVSHFDSSTHFQERFFRELTTWMNLNPHPNILPCLFYRTLESGEVVIVSPYVEGGTLATWILSGRTTNLSFALKIGIQIADGLCSIHSDGCIHQDLKPSNILMTEEGVPLINDFGLARAVMSDKSLQGFTRAYCSPEQSCYEIVTSATDIFSWGVTLAHILFGKLSWLSGDDLIADWTSLAESINLDDEIRALIAQCLNHAPSNRPTSIELASKLRRIAKRIQGETFNIPTSSLVEDGETKDKTTYSHLYNLTSGAEFGRVMLGPVYWHIKARGLSLSVEGYPESKFISNSRADLIHKIAEYEKLVQVFTHAVYDQPIILPWLIRLLTEYSLAQNESGDFEGAIRSARKAIEIFGDSEALDNNDSAFVHLAASKSLVCIRQYNEALKEINIASNLLPKQTLQGAQLLKEQGNLLADLSRLDDAVEAYRQSISILEVLEVSIAQQSLISSVYAELSRVFQRSKKLNNALSCIAKSLNYLESMNLPEDMARSAEGNARYFQGTILADSGRHDEAISEYDKAIFCFSAFDSYLEIQMMSDAVELSKGISLMRLNQIDSAIAKFDEVITRRKLWVDNFGQIRFADSLAKAYLNKSSALSLKGNITEKIKALFSAYELYAKLNNLYGRKDIWPELYHTSSILGEEFLKLGDIEFARKFLGVSTGILEQLCENAENSSIDLLFGYRCDLVTRYYQISYLLKDTEYLESREQLLDSTIQNAFCLIEEGAGWEMMDRYVAATTDKAALAYDRSQIKEVHLWLDRAIVVSRLLILQNKWGWVNVITNYTRSFSFKAAMFLTEELPNEAISILTMCLQEIEEKGVEELSPQSINGLANAWICKSRAQRDISDLDGAVESFSRAALYWENLIDHNDCYEFCENYSESVSHYIAWLQEINKKSLASEAATRLIDLFRRTYTHTKAPAALEAVNHYSKHFGNLLK
jgi:serine/threonine protein kinase